MMATNQLLPSLAPIRPAHCSARVLQPLSQLPQGGLAAARSPAQSAFWRTDVSFGASALAALAGVSVYARRPQQRKGCSSVVAIRSRHTACRAGGPSSWPLPVQADEASDTLLQEWQKPFHESMRMKIMRSAKLMQECADRFRPEVIDRKGIGLVAVRDFAPGELVASEAPVIQYSGVSRLGAVAEGQGQASWEAGIRSQFEKLSAKEQQQVRALARSSDDKKGFGGILKPNVYARGFDSMDRVLCIGMSLFNFSCSPNLEQSWNGETRKLQVRATRAIKAGEELCTYAADLRAPREDRKKSLRDQYGFDCQCEACQKPDEESENRRRHMLALLGMKPSEKPPREALKVFQKLITLYKQEHSFPKLYLKQAYFYVFQICLMIRELDWARSAAKQAARWSTACHGESHRDTSKLVTYAKYPRSHPAYSQPKLLPYL